MTNECQDELNNGLDERHVADDKKMPRANISLWHSNKATSLHYNE